jgi:hypothetical protein
LSLKKAERALQAAQTLPEIKQIIDLAGAAKEYARAASLGESAAIAAEKIKIQAQRKAGGLLTRCETPSPDLRLPLQPFHDSPDLFGCVPTDVEKADELLDRHPAQITQTLISCIEKGSQNYGPEPEMMSRHGRLVVEPDVHPRGPINASRTGAFAEAHFLSRQKADLICLLDSGKERLFQRPPGAEDLLTR